MSPSIFLHITDFSNWATDDDGDETEFGEMRDGCPAAEELMRLYRGDRFSDPTLPPNESAGLFHISKIPEGKASRDLDRDNMFCPPTPPPEGKELSLLPPSSLLRPIRGRDLTAGALALK